MVFAKILNILFLSLHDCAQLQELGKKLKYDEFAVASTLLDVDDGYSLRVVAARHNIVVTNIHQHLKGRSRSPKKTGCKTALLLVEEMAVAQTLTSLRGFGMSFDVTELRRIAKHFLDS